MLPHPLPSNCETCCLCDTLPHPLLPTCDGCCPGPSPALRMGMDDTLAARCADPSWKCRSTMQSAYPSTVRIVSAGQQAAQHRDVLQVLHMVTGRDKATRHVFLDLGRGARREVCNDNMLHMEGALWMQCDVYTTSQDGHFDCGHKQ